MTEQATIQKNSISKFIAMCKLANYFSGFLANSASGLANYFSARQPAMPPLKVVPAWQFQLGLV
jgi:hypothetical protein